MQTKKITFPHMGNYHIPIKKLMQTLSECEIITPPTITKKTIELGAKHSPDFVCTPFKYTLGNYIQSFDLGANVLIQTGGGCRLGYYGETQEQILRDLGYKFEFYKIDTTKISAPKEFYCIFKNINPNLTLAKTLHAFGLAMRQVYAIDAIGEYVRKNVGFEAEAGSFDKLEKNFLKALEKTNSIFAVDRLCRAYMRELKSLKVNKVDAPIKVGIVGELYTLMEPFSNHFLEKELAKFGVEVTRYIDLSYLLFSLKHTPKKIMRQAEGYLKYEIGADGTDSVAKSVHMAKAGYDGIIHIKPFGCTPEVNSMPMMQKISNDMKIPILYFSFDSQTSETGVKTRLEAFYDMLSMKRKGVAI